MDAKSPASKESMLEYLEVSSGMRKPAHPGNITSEYKNVHDKNYFEGLTQWVDSIQRDYKPMRKSPSSISLLNSNPSDYPSDVNDGSSFLFRTSFYQISMLGKSISDTPLNIQNKDSFSVNEVYIQPSTLGIINNEDAILEVLKSTEILMNSINIDKEQLSSKKLKQILESSSTSMLVTCITNIELVISWLRYQIYRNEDTSSPPPSKETQSQPQPAINIVHPKQVLIHSYRVAQMVESLSKHGIWKLLKQAVNPTTVPQQAASDLLSRLSDLKLTGQLCMSLVRLIVFIIEIQTHVNIVTNASVQDIHSSRHVPSSPNSRDSGRYSGSLLRSMKDFQTVIRNILSLVSSVQASIDATVPFDLKEASLEPTTTAMYISTMESSIVDMEAIRVVVDLLSHGNFSSITGQYYQASTANVIGQRTSANVTSSVSESSDTGSSESVDNEAKVEEVSLASKVDIDPDITRVPIKIDISSDDDDDDNSEDVDAIVRRIQQLPISNDPIKNPIPSSTNQSQPQKPIELVEQSIALITNLTISSLIRSRLCHAACRYLEYMRKGKLSWQLSKSNTFSKNFLPSTESMIVTLYERAFDIEGKDHHPTFIEQLLMFESSADLFLSCQSKDQESASMNNHPHLPIFLDLSSKWYSNDHVFKDIQLSVEIYHGLSIRSLVSFYQSQDIAVQANYVLPYFAKVILDKSPYHAFAILDLCSFLIRSTQLPIQSYADHSAQALNILQLLQSAASYDLHSCYLRIKKETLLIGSKVGRPEKVIESGVCVLDRLCVNSQHENIAFDQNLAEIKFLVELVTKSLLDISMYEKAIQTLQEFIRVLTYRLSVGLHVLNQQDSNSSKKHHYSDKLVHKFHKIVDPICLRIGIIYLTSGLPFLAAAELQRFLDVLSTRKLSNNLSVHQSTTSLQNFARSMCDLKIATLSWLAQAYLDMNNPEAVKKVIASIKSLRNDLSISQGRSPPKQTTRPRQDSTFTSGGFDSTTDELLNESAAYTGPRQSSVSFDNSIKTSSGPPLSPKNSAITPIDKKSSKPPSNQYINNLPNVGVSQFNLDLGEILALTHLKTHGYVAALKSLTPTIIAMELKVFYAETSQQQTSLLNSSITEAKLELARMYLLRGEIQLKAAASCVVKYPFVIGSSQLHAAIVLVYEQEGFYPLNKTNASNFQPSCRIGMKYHSPSELLWEALKWLELSRGLYKSVGSTEDVARVSAKIASCHLEALFVPCVFFHKPRDIAADLGSILLENNSDFEQGITNREKRANIEEAENAVLYSLNASSDLSLPVTLLESYISMAELKLIQDESFEAIAYWWEARELFLHLFVDGASIPILRRASPIYSGVITSLLDRLVRFLWACERPILNTNLLLLDLHIISSMDNDRILKNAYHQSTKLCANLDALLDNLRDHPSHSQLNGSSVSSIPSEAKTRILQTWLSFSSSMASLSVSVTLERLVTYPQEWNSNNGGVSIASPSHAGRERQRSGGRASEMPIIIEDLGSYIPLLPSRISSQLYFPWTSDSLGSLHDDTTEDGNYVEDIWRCFCNVSEASYLFSSIQLARGQDGQSNRKALVTLTILMRKYRNVSRQHDPLKECDLTMESLTRRFGNRRPTIDDYLRLDSASLPPGYSLSPSGRLPTSPTNADKLRGSRENNESPRRADGGKLSAERYDNTYLSATSTMNTSRKAISMKQRLRNLVYCLHIGELLMMYRPSAGTQYIQPFQGGGHVTYSERSQAWLLHHELHGIFPANMIRKASSLGPGGYVGSMGGDIIVPSSDNADDNIGLVGGDYDALNQQFEDSVVPNRANLGSNSYDQDDEEGLEDGFGNTAPLAPNIAIKQKYGSSIGTIAKLPSSIGSQKSVSSQQGSTSSQSISVRTSHPIPAEFLAGPPSKSGTYPSYASIASSTASARIPTVTSLTTDQSKLIYDLATDMNENCGGGLEGRKAILAQLRSSDFLLGALEFLREAEFDPQTPADDGSGASSSVGKRTPSVTSTDSKKYNAYLPSGLIRLFQSSTSSTSDPALPPYLPTPVTLICSKAACALPWEALAGYGTSPVIARQASLLTMVTFVSIKGGNFLTGPAWYQTPSYLSIAQGMSGLPAKLVTDVKSRELGRRVEGAIHCLHTATQKVSHLVRLSKETLNIPQPSLSGISEDIRVKYLSIVQSYREKTLPSPSALIPLGKLSSQSLRSRRLKKFNFYDLYSCISSKEGVFISNYLQLLVGSSGLKHFHSWIESSGSGNVNLGNAIGSVGGGNTPSASYYAASALNAPSFPVILLTYADLMDMSEAVSSLLLSRGDALVIFAPHFCQGTIAKEIVRNFDLWCSSSTVIPATVTPATSPTRPSAPTSPTASVSPTGLRLRTDSFNSIVGSNGGAATVGRSSVGGGASTVVTGMYEPTEIELSTKTFAYHAVMDAVGRLQVELAVPIVVFI